MQHSISSAYRIISLLTVVGLLFLVPACDSGSDDGADDGGNGGGNESANVEGMWQVASGPDVLYIYITGDTVTFIDYLGDSVDQGDDCYDYETLDIISDEGGILQLGDADEPAFTIPFTFSRNGDNLVIGYAGFGLTLSSSSETPSSLTPQCDFGGKKDPAYKFGL